MESKTPEQIAETYIKNDPDFKAEGFSPYQNGKFNGFIDGYNYRQPEVDELKRQVEDAQMKYHLERIKYTQAHLDQLAAKEKEVGEWQRVNFELNDYIIAKEREVAHTRQERDEYYDELHKKRWIVTELQAENARLRQENCDLELALKNM